MSDLTQAKRATVAGQPDVRDSESHSCPLQTGQAHAQSELAIQQLEQKLPIAMSRLSADGRILSVNERFVETFGYTLDDMRTIEDWWPRAYPDPSYRREVMEKWSAAINQSIRGGIDIPPLEYRITCKNGEERLVVVSGAMLGEELVATFIDITERRRAEEIQGRLNRELRAISECNQAMMRAGDEQALLNDVCHIVCEQAGYRMAWVGYAERDDARTVRPGAWAGEENGYLSQTGLTWADTPAGHRPLGIAIRTGATSYVQDFNEETESAPWIEHARQRGYRSAIALPLKDDKAVVFGVLCLYASQTHSFTDDEIKLLEELAADLAFGVVSLRLRAEQTEAKDRLAASEQLFRALVENSPDIIARYDRELRRIYINPAMRKLFEAPLEQVIGNTPRINTPLDDPERYIACLRRVIETGAECIEELPFRNFDGEQHWASMRFTPELASDGKPATVLVISHDITERVRAEEESMAHLHFLEALDRINRAIQETIDLDQMMRDVLKAVLSIFDCDRAFLLYPCDPTATHWSVPMEHFRPEYPGAVALGQPIPMDPDVASNMELVLNAAGPLRIGPGNDLPLPRSTSERFGFKSFLTTALRPKLDKAWEFGIQQCSRERVWTSREVRLFEEISHRISDALNNLLITRNLTESEERFRLVFENSPVCIQEEDYSAVKIRLDELLRSHGDDLAAYLVDHPEIVTECTALVRMIDANRAALNLHETSRKEEILQGLPSQFTEQTIAGFRYLLLELAAGKTTIEFETITQTLKGRRQDVSVYFSVCPGYEQSLGKVFVSLIDITERKRAVEELRLAASVFATSQEGIMISDSANRVIDVNPAFTRLTGYRRDEAIGRDPRFLSAGRQSRQFYADMWQSIRTHGSWQGELWNRRKDGTEFVELLTIIAVKNEEGQLQHYVGVFSDISILKAHEADLDRIAHYDTLTGVANRRLLSDRLEQAIARVRRHGKFLAVCYLDLDGFKPINDQFGHEGGDRLLVEIAHRLESVSRAEDTVARLGGDEFVLLWNDIDAEKDCFQALERILDEVSAPMMLDGVPVSVSASIGVTLYPDDDVDADNLLRHADHAMYSAKQLGKNRYQIFDARLERQISSRVEFMAKLTRGLEAGQFELHYQPKVDCLTGTVGGVEALIRWHDPILGIVGPKEFLPLIENDNLAFRMGRWVMEQAVRQAKRWHEMGITLPISVNVFPRHLKYPTFVDDLRSAIAQYWPEMPKKRLLMEIVETSDLEELDPIEQVITQCLAMGIGFSLDDFGTGYSSLVYLRRLSVEELKIDQSFVRDMLQDPDDLAIVVGVIGLGRAFGLRVVAEGVESTQQAKQLVDLGCSVVQGYGLGRPMPAEAFQKWYADFLANGGPLCR